MSASPPNDVHVQIRRGVSPLGIASLVIGIIACLFCWIPFLGLFAIPLAGIGLILALVALIMASVNKSTGFAFPISGGIVCLLSIVVALVMTGGFAALIQKSANEAKASANSDESKADSQSIAARSDQNIFPLTFEQGNIKGKITEVVHGYTTGESTKERGLIVKTSNFLLIEVSVSNTSSNRIYDYTTLRNGAVLTDDRGNSYRKIESNKTVNEYGKMSVGWVAPYPFANKFYGNATRIGPHMGREDMLGFDIPDAPGTVLHLELNAENFGGTGTLQFEIPVTAIKDW